MILNYKKGQVTVFIIVGMIILVAVASFLLIRQQTIVKQPIFEKQDISEEFTPVVDYVENCIKDVAAEGLILLGERGGFIDPIASGFTSNSDATESSAVSLADNWKLPYWYYMASANNENSFAFVSIPAVSLGIKKGDAPITIEGQLEDFLAEKAPQCINFEAFEQQGYVITPQGSPEAVVLVADQDIVFSINYPLKIKKSTTVEIENFFVRIPININKIFEMATLITYLEQNFHFLENHALNIITAYSGTDKLIPPMSATEFSMSQKTWQRNDVEARIKEALQINIPSLSVSGTANYKQIDVGNSFRNSIYNSDFYLSADESVYAPVYGSFSDLSVYFDYLPAELYFDANCDPICKPEGASSNWLSLIGMQRYNTVYDLSFPVKIEITVPVTNKAIFNKDHYSFNFMLEANIRNNEPLNASTVLIEALDTGLSSITFDEIQKTSAEVTIATKDSLTKQNLDRVNIFYTCVDETGFMGETVSGILKSKFPICLGGILTAVKDGYIQYSTVLSTDIQTKKTVNLELAPKVSKNIIIKKALMQKQGSGNNAKFVPVDSTFANPVVLGNNERATLTISRTDSINEEDYVNFIEIDGNQPAEMQLAPGTYNIDIKLFYNDPIVIPDQDIEGETIEGTTIEEEFLNGDLVCKFEIKEEDLANSNTITFTVLSSNIPGIPESDRELTDLSISSAINADGKFCSQLKPRFE